MFTSLKRIEYKPKIDALVLELLRAKKRATITSKTSIILVTIVSPKKNLFSFS